ncbi:MAG: hydrolase TatD [Chloroflexota bacterium]
MLVDTHCHLDHPRFDADIGAVIARAHEAGVLRMVTIGTGLPSSRAAVALAERYAGVYAAVGVHPHEAKDWDAATLAELEQLARHPKVVAIGEIGLDFYRDWSPRQAQARAFEAQLALAQQLGLPVIIHDREAHEAVLATLRAYAPVRGVLHSFSGDAQVAEAALALGLYLGISGSVTFPKADALRQVVALAPLERLLIETDAPYLTPQAHRGRRNEPAYVRYVAEEAAAVKGFPLEVVAAQTTANAEALFFRDGGER